MEQIKAQIATAAAPSSKAVTTKVPSSRANSTAWAVRPLIWLAWAFNAALSIAGLPQLAQLWARPVLESDVYRQLMVDLAAITPGGQTYFTLVTWLIWIGLGLPMVISSTKMEKEAINAILTSTWAQASAGWWILCIMVILYDVVTTILGLVVFFSLPVLGAIIVGVFVTLVYEITQSILQQGV